jgi:hypothetical protein
VRWLGILSGPSSCGVHMPLAVSRLDQDSPFATPVYLNSQACGSLKVSQPLSLSSEGPRPNLPDQSLSGLRPSHLTLGHSVFIMTRLNKTAFWKELRVEACLPVLSPGLTTLALFSHLQTVAANCFPSLLVRHRVVLSFSSQQGTDSRTPASRASSF